MSTNYVDQIKKDIEGSKLIRYLDDRATEVEEELADAFGFSDYPDNENYDGPMILLPHNEGGFVIKVSVEHVPDHLINRVGQTIEENKL